MTLADRTLWTLRRYSTDRLGVDREAFDRVGMTIGPATEGGVQVFGRDDALVIGAPESLVPTLRRRIDDLASLDITDLDAVHETFTDLGAVERVLGPTFYGYVDRETFTPVESNARVLTAADEPSYERFQAAFAEDEWEHGGSGFEPGEVVGLFVGGDLVAAAAYDIWAHSLAHVGVVTHPSHRNEGYGRAVVSRATERALSEGHLLQYRTLDAWPWSVALAKGLGFERFATSVLVLFNESERTPT